MPAVGAAVGGREARQTDRHQRQDQGEQVHEHMGGIGQQRQGVGPETTGDLGDQRHRGQGDGQVEATAQATVEVGGRRVLVVVGTGLGHWWHTGFMVDPF